MKRFRLNNFTRICQTGNWTEKREISSDWLSFAKWTHLPENTEYCRNLTHVRAVPGHLLAKIVAQKQTATSEEQLR